MGFNYHHLFGIRHQCSNITVTITVRCHYNAVNFLENPHNRHPVARPWVRIMAQVMSGSLQCCVEYDIILDRVITALDCISLSKWLVSPVTEKSYEHSKSYQPMPFIKSEQTIQHYFKHCISVLEVDGHSLPSCDLISLLTNDLKMAARQLTSQWKAQKQKNVSNLLMKTCFKHWQTQTGLAVARCSLMHTKITPDKSTKHIWHSSMHLIVVWTTCWEAHRLNSFLVPGRRSCNLRLVIFKLISSTDILRISCKITIQWMPQDFTDD